MSKQEKSAKQRELRTISGSKLEIRESVQGEKKLAGYAVVFNSPTNIGGSFFETIAPGSFTKTLQEDDQIMLRDHRSELLLGRRSAGTLALRQDQNGVAFEVILPDSELGRSTYESVKRRDLQGCSFGFYVRDDEWSQDASGTLMRVIKDLQCFEVTLTSMPAYDSTSVDIRSVRQKLGRSAVDDDDDVDCSDPDSPDYESEDCEEEEDRSCDCSCSSCEDGDCLACSDTDCSDEQCLANRCGIQERHLHFQLITRRLRR